MSAAGRPASSGAATEAARTTPASDTRLLWCIAIGQTIQQVEGVRYPPGPWDNLPSQSICLTADNERFLRLYADTLAAWAAGRG